MHEFGRGVSPAESLVEQHVQGSGRKPFFASDNVRNLHQVVVDDIGQMVCGQVVGAFVKHLVVENIALYGHKPAKHVVYFHVAARLYFEANHVLVACVDKRLHLFFRHRQGIAHRHTSRCVVLEVWYLGAFGLKLGGCVECYVCLACVEKHFHVLAVYVAAFALLVWSVRSAFAHAFVYAYSEPRKSLVDIVFRSRHETL